MYELSGGLILRSSFYVDKNIYEIRTYIRKKYLILRMPDSIIREKSGTEYFPGVMRMKQVHLRIDDELYNELNTYSTMTDQTMQDCVREAVAYYVTDMRRKQQSVKDRRFTFIDLFAGIGGMRIAFERAGGHCVYSNEWNKYSQQTYFANFGEQPEGDITQVPASSIPDHDILVAGFPCQPFSIAGVSKKKSLGRATGFEDKTQGTLFFDVCRILKEKRPKAFMLENVKNLCSHDKGRTFKVILESLDELNYSVFYAVLDGQNYVPQHRERIVIVGFDRERYGSEVDFEFNLTPQDPKPVMRDILEKTSILFPINCGLIFRITLQHIKQPEMVSDMELHH